MVGGGNGLRLEGLLPGIEELYIKLGEGEAGNTWLELLLIRATGL